MPTEVYPSSHHLSAPLPPHAGWSNSPFPPTGRARTLDLLAGPAPLASSVPRHVPLPGSVLPNGLRNPWAPYAGETYRPSAEVAASIQGQAFSGSGSGSGGHGYGGANMNIAPPGAVSLISGGGGGASLAPSAAVGLGGYREDDGWNGSLGRSHAAHAPDFSSTAGAIGPLRAPSAYGGVGGSVLGGSGSVVGGPASSAGWLNQPAAASWGNHARMTPHLLPSNMASGGWGEVPQSYGHGPPAPAPAPAPVAPPVHARRSRRRSVPLPTYQEEYSYPPDCPDCRSASVSVSVSGGEAQRIRISPSPNGHGHGHIHRRSSQHQGHAHKRVSSVPLPVITVESPYRRVRELSPHVRGEERNGQLERRASGRSRASRCSECEC